MYQIMKIIEKIGYRVELLWRAIEHGKLVWIALCIVAIVATLAYACAPGSASERLALSGAILQIFGVGTVAAGLHKTRLLFGRPGIGDFFKSWGAKIMPVFLRRKGGQTVNVTGVVEQEFALPITAATGWSKTASTVEEKLEEIRRKVDALESNIQSQTKRLDRKIDEEEKKRQITISEAQKDAERKIEEATIGGIHIEEVGLILLAVGIIFGTIPDYMINLVMIR